MQKFAGEFEIEEVKADRYGVTQATGRVDYYGQSIIGQKPGSDGGGVEASITFHNVADLKPGQRCKIEITILDD